MMMGYYGVGSLFGWMGMALGIIIHVALAFIVVAGAVWLVKAVGSKTGSQHENEALGILKNRYARGEISIEQFHNMKQELS